MNMSNPPILWGMDPLLHVPLQLFIHHVNALAPAPDKMGVFRHHSHPVQNVEIMGVIQSVTRKQAMIFYTLDDGTGTIQCIMWIPDQHQLVQDISTIPSLRLFSLGQVIRVIGQPGQYRDSMQLVAQPGDISLCLDPNDETVFRLRVVNQEKNVYTRPMIYPEIVLQEAEMSDSRRTPIPVNPDMLADRVRQWLSTRVQKTFIMRDLDTDTNIRQFAQDIVLSMKPSLPQPEVYSESSQLMITCIRQLLSENAILMKDFQTLTFEILAPTIEIIELD